MDYQPPRTGPATGEELTVSPEMMQRLADTRAQMAQEVTGPTLVAEVPNVNGFSNTTNPEIIDPAGYSKKMKAAPLVAVSNAERAKRKSANNVFDFPIPELDDEYGAFIAKVTKPSILSLIESGTMPHNLRKAVDKLISAGEKGVQEATQEMMSESMSDSLGTLLTVANYMCVVGFVDPKVVATHEEAESLPGRIHYSDLPHEARMRFWSLIQGEAEEMAEAVKPFPEQTVESGDVGSDVRVDVVPSE